jgi:hypothetical protein
MLIAQLTDPHVRPPGQCAYSIADTYALLAQAVDVASSGSSAATITGRSRLAGTAPWSAWRLASCIR